MPPWQAPSRIRERRQTAVTEALRQHCESLPAPERVEEFGAAFDRFGEARIVLLGEASHGTSEFYRARAAITRRLIEQHGFNIVAVEADWPDAARIDRYVRHREAGPDVARPSRDFRPGCGATRSSRLHGLAAGTTTRPCPSSSGSNSAVSTFTGCAAPSRAVLDYLDRVDPGGGEDGASALWMPHAVARGAGALWARGHARSAGPCEDAVVAQLRDVLDKRLDWSGEDGEDYFDAAQNARIVRAAEQYYRIMYQGSTESWNLRDRHMFDTLQHVVGAVRRQGSGLGA